MQSIFLWITTSATRIGSAVLNAGAGLSLILLAACGQQAPEQSMPLPQVQVITVAAQTIEDEPEFIGQTEAFRPVEIRPQVSGIIKQVYFTEGRNAKKGDKLYLIDPVPFKAIYLSAKARVAQMQARLNQAKQDLLKVKETTLTQYGAVSEQVAMEMAIGALQQGRSTIAASITGIAGPDGGTAPKPVGTVCFAWTSDNLASISKTYLFQGNREQIREQSTIALLLGLKDLLKQQL
ncbi:MAG: nicotinamide-nucleotide amidohydrolase family protein [Nitrosomonadaceae bacterium]|nr:nicotinamide-nucleotide amidohydrolase family protein [Nitrosomonadaceae bacterium]